MRSDGRSGALGWILAILLFSLGFGAEGALASIGGLQFRPYLPLLVIAALVVAARAMRKVIALCPLLAAHLRPADKSAHSAPSATVA